MDHIKGKKSQCFYPNQTAERFLSTGYALMNGTSPSVFKYTVNHESSLWFTVYYDICPIFYVKNEISIFGKMI